MEVLGHERRLAGGHIGKLLRHDPDIVFGKKFINRDGLIKKRQVGVIIPVRGTVKGEKLLLRPVGEGVQIGLFPSNRIFFLYRLSLIINNLKDYQYKN